ncbi:MAG TPA: hypothetical protein VFZ76_12690 [Anaerolineales bacterium]
MAQTEKEILNGEIRVILPGGLQGYDVYEKPIPQALKNHPDFGKYDWIGNFGLKDAAGKEVSGKVKPPYVVQVVKKAGRNKLVYWDGQDIVELKASDAKVGNRNYGAANLDLGDPPVGWG